MRRSIARLNSVLYEEFPHACRVTLNREKALNSLNVEMVERMLPMYQKMHKLAPRSHVVVLRGAGTKAFCAGGDVVSLVNDTPAGTQKSFFYREYQLNNLIATLPQPHVALWDGIVMGGGVGVSVHGSHRIATEKALFAMPETAIGLFPDVGGSWFLPRLPVPGLGMYLSLTGARLKGADLLHAGIATHYVESASIPHLEAALIGIKDPKQVDDVIHAHAAKAVPAFSLAASLGSIEKHFGGFPKSVEGIFDSLKADGGDWAAKTLAILDKCSPSSLKVSLALHNEGAKAKTHADVFKMEYFASQRAMAGKDFHRGVTALLIEKSKEAPKWEPATLAAVTDAEVAEYFAPCRPDVPTWQPSGEYPAKL